MFSSLFSGLIDPGLASSSSVLKTKILEDADATEEATFETYNDSSFGFSFFEKK